MTQRVQATQAAVEMLDRLEREHGPIALFQSGGCCAGSAAMCLTLADMPPGPDDLCLGKVGAAAFYVDREQYERWREPEFVLDVAPGAAGGFSLEQLEDAHFVTRSPATAAEPAPDDADRRSR
jgi:uncharacterized protein (DUF779 family)